MKILIIIITFLAFSSTQYAQTYKPGDHEVFFMPTAKTIPRGSSYFADYEVLFLNYTFAPTNCTKETAKAQELKYYEVEMKTSKDIRNLSPSPFGIFSIIIMKN